MSTTELTALALRALDSQALRALAGARYVVVADATDEVMSAHLTRESAFNACDLRRAYVEPIEPLDAN